MALAHLGSKGSGALGGVRWTRCWRNSKQSRCDSRGMARYSESAFQNFHTVRSVRSVSSKAKESRSKFIHCIFLCFSVSQFFPGAEKRVNRKKGGGPSGIPRVPALPFPCLPLLDCHFSKQKLHCDEARLRRMMAHHKELLSRLALGGGIGLFKHKSMIS